MTPPTDCLTQPCPSEGPALEDLSRPGRVIVALLRGASVSGGDACTLLGESGLGGRCLAALVALLGVLAAGGRRPDVAAPRDPVLTLDELAIHDSLASLQQGRPWQVQRLLGSWLAPALVPHAVGLLAVVAEELSRAGLRITGERSATMLH
jgi:hypothetical protein